MDSNLSASLSATQGASQPPKILLSNSGSFPIRAPPSDDASDDDKDIIEDEAEDSISGSEDGSETAENYISGEEDFETASERPFVPDPDEENIADEDVAVPPLEESSDVLEDSVGFLPPMKTMPIAQPSRDDDDEVVHEVFASEGEDDGFSGVARVPPLVEISESDYSETGVLGGKEKRMAREPPSVEISETETGALGANEKVLEPSPASDGPPLSKPGESTELVDNSVSETKTVEGYESNAPPEAVSPETETINLSEMPESGVFVDDDKNPSPEKDKVGKSPTNLAVDDTNQEIHGNPVSEKLEVETMEPGDATARNNKDELASGNAAVEQNHVVEGDSVFEGVPSGVLGSDESTVSEGEGRVHEFTVENDEVSGVQSVADQNSASEVSPLVEASPSLSRPEAGNVVAIEARDASNSQVEDPVVEKPELLSSSSHEAISFTDNPADSSSTAQDNEGSVGVVDDAVGKADIQSSQEATDGSDSSNALIVEEKAEVQPMPAADDLEEKPLPISPADGESENLSMVKDDNGLSNGDAITHFSVEHPQDDVSDDFHSVPEDGGKRKSESLNEDHEIAENINLSSTRDNNVSVDEISSDSQLPVSKFSEARNEDKADSDEDKDGSVIDKHVKISLSETAELLIKEMEHGSTSSQEYSHKMDGQIISDSDEEVDTDEDGDGKLFDSAALAALLKAATSAGPADASITVSSGDGPSRIFSVERPAGLGSTVPSLKPTARPNRPSIFSPSDLAVVGEDDSNMDGEEKKLQEKIHQIRVKFLRLVQRLGHTPEDTVAAQVLYRLNLAEGIRRARHTNRSFSLDCAKKAAGQLESAGKDDLDFSFNVLILGKTGVGKSATINSIFGEEKTQISAFEPTTTGVKEITGVVDGVNVRVVDTPGLKSSVMDQGLNRKILSSIKKFTKKCPPDIVLYVDRLDTHTRDFNDIPLLRSISSVLGSSIWLNAIVALTHAASAPPDGPNGSPLSYDVLVAQRSHIVQHSIRQAAGDMRLMNPVALVENHPSCRKIRGQSVLPNGQIWRPQLLLLCYSSKILSEANSLLKLQDSSAGKLFGFRVRSPPLPFLLSSLLQSRAHPKLASDQGGDNEDSDIDLADLSDSDQEEGEDEYDQLPPFKPLRKAQIEKLSKEQRKAYFDEYDYRAKLLQKKQWKEELKRLKELKKRGKEGQADFGYGDTGEDFDPENGAPAAVPVPLPDMVLPPSFDGDNPGYRYRFLEPTSGLLARPVLDTHGWDHDSGYDGVSLEESLAIASRFPAVVSVQITKDKKEFNIHLDSSVSAKHGDKGSSLAGFDIQSVGKQLAYILRGETKFKNLKRNKTTAGVSVTFLGENVATGLKIEDQISIGKRLSLVGSTGAVRSQGDVAYGANLEARLREKDYPIGQDQATLGLSLMRWRGDLALGANLQSQFSIGRNSRMAVRVGLNNKLSGQITIRTSSSEQLQIALVGLLPIASTILRTIFPGEAYYVH
ncbi:translocase of chloroplast 101, chloroplastic-like isoform X2 [Aristolochia californica]|uniref:translocase of chloroplast 101, chloroplastic-like isoform X2 n=1 Tax=Aristolochia californica TaxID=171875 RepID=UPI0035DB1668